jgi:hypothetical protein
LISETDTNRPYREKLRSTMLVTSIRSAQPAKSFWASSNLAGVKRTVSKANTARKWSLILVLIHSPNPKGAMPGKEAVRADEGGEDLKDRRGLNVEEGTRLSEGP